MTLRGPGGPWVALGEPGSIWARCGIKLGSILNQFGVWWALALVRYGSAPRFGSAPLRLNSLWAQTEIRLKQDHKQGTHFQRNSIGILIFSGYTKRAQIVCLCCFAKWHIQKSSSGSGCFFVFERRYRARRLSKCSGTFVFQLQKLAFVA